jgi:hypothetical protein
LIDVLDGVRGQVPVDVQPLLPPPHEADAFVARARPDTAGALASLVPCPAENPHAPVPPKAGGRTSLSPGARPETDLRVGFPDAFRGATASEGVGRATLQQRLLLCLHGPGTNTGLKRLDAGEHGATRKDPWTCGAYQQVPTPARSPRSSTSPSARLPQVWGEARPPAPPAPRSPGPGTRTG